MKSLMKFWQNNNCQLILKAMLSFACIQKPAFLHALYDHVCFFDCNEASTAVYALNIILTQLTQLILLPYYLQSDYYYLPIVPCIYLFILSCNSQLCCSCSSYISCRFIQKNEEAHPRPFIYCCCTERIFTAGMILPSLFCEHVIDCTIWFFNS